MIRNSKVINRYFILAVLQALTFLSFSQKQSLKFQHLTAQDGLSQSHATCILQDKKGFMWIGTRSGLNKYDGYHFTVYTNKQSDPKSITHNYVTDLGEDANGNLWIATFGGGISMFDPERIGFTNYKHNENISSIASDYISSLMVDNLGDVWLATDANGLDKFDRKNNRFLHYIHKENDFHSLSANNVKDVFQDSQGNIWVGVMDGGLNLFDQKNNTFSAFMPDPFNLGLSGSNSVRTIFEDSRKQLWIGTLGGGLFLFNQDTREFQQFKHDPADKNSLALNVILSLKEDSKGNLWIGTENGGLSILDLQTMKFHNFAHDDIDNASLSNNSVYSLCNDDKGNMWVGTFSGGINFFNLDESKFTHYRHSNSPNSLSNNIVLRIYEDSHKNLWIATDGGGLNLMDRENGNFTHFKHENSNNSISGNFVLQVLEDSEGNLWIGTWGDGITVFNKEKNTYKFFKNDPVDPLSLSSNNARAILEDSEKNIWIGTQGGGLELYNKKTESFLHYRHSITDPTSLCGDVINVLFEDQDGNLWIGTNGSGLDRLNKKTGTFTHFVHDKNNKPISSNIIGSIFQDKNGNLWVGTTMGLNQINLAKNTITNFFIEDGLPSLLVNGVLGDDHGNLWISTGKGLSKFNPSTRTFRNYDVSDGLQANEFKPGCYKSRDGRMYFGGINGFNEFFPDSIKENIYDPSIVLTGFQIFNKPVETMKDFKGVDHAVNEMTELALSYTQSVITFEFASLNYTIRDRKQYAYLLEGFDKDWNNIGTQHSATYTNLDPGDYVFKVRGLDNSGNWSNKNLTISLYITPPYWQTWWFRLLLVSFTVGCFVAFYLIRFSIVKTQKRILETQVKKRTEELAHSTEEERNARREAERAWLEAEKARLEAEKANLAKSVFLATMSHEIRTPMNGVIGMASLLSETSQTSEQQEYTETIKNCGESLLTVINDILDFSKIESGKMELENKDFDLRTCIEEVLDVFSGKAAKAGLDLIYEIDYNVPAQIIGDSVRLRQVILNLVGNAIKFTHKGEIFIGVHLLNTIGESIELGFEVRDTGIGIPVDKIDRLFKAFSQVDSSTTRKYGGTGLGLVICEKLVELMGGRILVESIAEQGTTFTFTIQAGVSKQSTRTYIHHNTTGIENKKVLIVDDNPTNRNILKNQLEQWKLVPTLAVSGEEALILSENSDFDLMLSDMQMPEMDGIELAKHIRRRNKKLPIILLSSVGDERTKEYDELFASVLTKPVKQNTLFKHIIAQLSPQKGKAIVEESLSKKKLSIEFAERYPLNILIAEDNPVNQKLAERVLTKLGYKPSKVMNGQEVLDALAKDYYDVILMDVQMPIMDGLEATRKIRLSKNAQPAIIAMTANAMQGDREICIQAGMDDYISKPIKLEDLVDLLEKWALQIKA